MKPTRVLNTALWIIIAACCALTAGSLFFSGSPRNGGNIPSPSSPPAPVTEFGEHRVKIVIEPERFLELEKPVKVTPDSAASGGMCIEIEEGAGKPPRVGGKAVCRFTVPKTAVYRLWGRRWWKDACGNSFLFSIAGDHPARIVDAGGKEPADAAAPHVFGEDASYNPELGIPWKWTKGHLYRLAAGTYTLTILNREDGVRLDQVLLVEVLEDDDEFPYIPVDVEKPSPPAPRKRK